ncbi:hypothetical protein ACLK2I_12610 [Escherichia coli]
MEAITGFRIIRALLIGGVAHDLPRGWDRLPRVVPRLDAETSGVLRESGAAKHHSKVVPMALPLTARKRRWSGAPPARACVPPGSTSTCVAADPYSGYENFDFEIPVGGGVSDCYTRVMLKEKSCARVAYS